MKWFALWCLAVLLGFAWLEREGIALFRDSEHAVVPSSVRGAPGAYRHYSHWGHGSSFHGGK